MSCYHDNYGNLMPEAAEYADDLAREANADCYEAEDSEEDSESDGSEIVVQDTTLMPPPKPEIKSWTTYRGNRAYKEYIGDPHLTVQTVINNILNHNVAQCYEFMRERVVDVTVLENGDLSIKTSYSLYAGD